MTSDTPASFLPQAERTTTGATQVLRRVQLTLDAAILAVSLVLAYGLRFDFSLPDEYARRLLVQLPLVLLLQLGTTYIVGIQSLVWRYVGLPDLAAFGRGAALAAAPLLLLRFFLPPSFNDWRMPLSVILMDTVLAFGGLAGVRVLRRAAYEARKRGRLARTRTGHRKPVLFVGAGHAGVLAAREIQGRGDADIAPVGFVDDDPLKQGMTIRGLRVLGTTQDIPRLARELGLHQVVVTIAEAPAGVLDRIVEICRREGLEVRTIPALHEVLQGRVSITRFRDVALEGLLGRDRVRLDTAELRAFLAGRAVMVTGAGGSIGRELARQIARFGPSLLVLYERAEFALFDADRELRELWPDLPIAPVVGDVTDPRRLAAVFASTRPEVVFHAAAHKHVPLMEENPGEAVKNNVFGTYLLGRAAIAAGTEALILISTDKAVRPTSVMGATKRVAELVCQTLAAQGPTRFVAVRFGNVLGSAGSVVQIFRDQIARGGPVRVTHPEMKRYFMMIPEAAQLVLQAATMGEDGDVLVLDMGEPVRIVDLARKMIDLSGMEPGKDVEIVFTGLRPGEKLFEELALEGEGHAPTSHPKIHRGHLTPYPPDQIAAALRALGPLAESGDGDGIRRCLQGLLPEARLGLERSAHPGGEKAELHPAAAPSY